MSTALRSLVLLAALAGSAAAAPAPLLPILQRFTAADVPAMGPAERPADPPKGLAAAGAGDDAMLGGGLGRHPMLYIGEGYNKMLLIDGGKVVWTYSTGKGGEFDDVWMLSNGDVLYSRQTYAEEVTPQKKIVWHLDAPQGTEIHTVQPIGLDQILVVENGLPPRALVIDKRTGAVALKHALPAPSLTDPKTIHGQFRRFRLTASGTYLAPCLEMNKVVELDRNFQEIWSYDISSPWAAVRLRNGNTLISAEHERLIREVNPRGETVWEFKLSELPPGIDIPDSQSCVRLANGNTVLCSRGDAGKGCQLIEITPGKKVVWVLKDWRDLGPATAVQLLDEPGLPERPGDLER